MIRFALIAGFSLSLIFGGCTCSDTRQRSGDGWVVSPDGSQGRDARRGDVVEDAGDTVERRDIPSRDVCGPSGVDFETVRFDVPFPSRAAPAMSGTTIFSEAVQSSQEGGEESIYTTVVDPETGEGRNLVEGRLLYADGGRALVAKETLDGETLPFRVDRRGNGVGAGSAFERWTPSRTSLRQSEGRPFDGTRFAAVLENDPQEAPGWVGYFARRNSEEVHIKEWVQPPVALTEEGFLVAGRTGPLSGGGNYEIFAYDASSAAGVTRVTETEKRHERDPVTTREWAYWNDDRGVYRASHSGGDRERIHRGVCGPVAASGERAVFSCEENPGDTPGHARAVYGRTFVLYDGSTTSEIPTGGGVVFHPRIDGRRVVWAEYDDPDALERGGTGRLRYWQMGWEEPRTVAPIGAPCFPCNAIQSDLHLSIYGDRIAWNYASPNDDGPRSSNFGAATTVEADCR